MNNQRIATELLKVAEEIGDYYSPRSKSLNYRVADMVMEEIGRIKGVDGVGRSDGFNGETTFTLTVHLIPSATDFSGETVEAACRQNSYPHRGRLRWT